MDSAKITDSRDDNSPAPPKLFPQWREVEQDFWLDMFDSYSEVLLNQNPEEDVDKIRDPDTWESYMIQKVRLAAKLADEATKEMVYRFERQKPMKVQKSWSEGRDERHKSSAARRRR